MSMLTNWAARRTLNSWANSREREARDAHNYTPRERRQAANLHEQDRQYRFARDAMLDMIDAGRVTYASQLDTIARGIETERTWLGAKRYNELKRLVATCNEIRPAPRKTLPWGWIVFGVIAITLSCAIAF